MSSRVTIVENTPVPENAHVPALASVTPTLVRIGAHAERMKPFASPVLKGAHPLNGCICTWVWCPDIGGTDTPFVRKFVNSACYAHIRASDD